MRYLLISLVFNVYWLIAVLGQDEYQYWLLPFLAAACFYDKYLLAIMPTLAILGIVGDTALVHLNILDFDGAHFLPYWLILLWLGFIAFVWLMRGVVLPRSMWLLIAIGGVGGAMSYLAGFRFGAVAFQLNTWLTFFILLATWACYTAAIVTLVRKTDRFIESREESV